MTIRRFLVLVIAVFLVTGLSVAQGPKKDIGKDVPLPPSSSDKRSGPPTKGGEQLPQGPSLSIDVDVVSFDVVVTDQSGNPIGSIEKPNVAYTAGGTTAITGGYQAISTFNYVNGLIGYRVDLIGDIRMFRKILLLP